MSCRHYQRGLRPPILDMNWFVDRRATDVNVLSIEDRSLSVPMEEINKGISLVNVVATVLSTWLYYRQRQAAY